MGCVGSRPTDDSAKPVADESDASTSDGSTLSRPAKHYLSASSSTATSKPYSRTRVSAASAAQQRNSATTTAATVKAPLRLGLDSDFHIRQQQQQADPPREFTHAEIEEATGRFSSANVLGEGGFGRVYRGVIREERPDGSVGERHVAVKQLNEEGLQGFNEWLTEVIFLRRLRHPHLVPLIGYCSDGEQGLLVYEFMSEGSLDYHLFDCEWRREAV